MADLSPAAQAVMEAIRKVPILLNDQQERIALSAALEALADQDETLFDVNEELMPAVRFAPTAFSASPPSCGEGRPMAEPSYSDRLALAVCGSSATADWLDGVGTWQPPAPVTMATEEP